MHRRRIVVNGVEYERVEDLPPEVRRMLQHELPPSFTEGSPAPADGVPQGADLALPEGHPPLPEWMRVETVAARQARLRRARLLAGALLLVALLAAAASLLLFG